MRHRLAEPGDLPLLRLDQRVELRDLDRVVALLVLAEAEQVRDVLRPPAVEEEQVLGVDRLAELLDLVALGPGPRSIPLPQSAASALATALPSIFSV